MASTSHPHTSAASLAGHTPGPWGWFGNQHGLYLATPDRGRRYIMGFRRQGLQGAQPTFQQRSIMVPASGLVKFAVGDGTARGMTEGRADPSVYRYDIKEIDHPDARLIAAAPDLLEAVRAFLAYDGDPHDGPNAGVQMMLDYDTALTLAKAAYAKATAS